MKPGWDIPKVNGGFDGDFALNESKSPGKDRSNP